MLRLVITSYSIHYTKLYEILGLDLLDETVDFSERVEDIGPMSSSVPGETIEGETLGVSGISGLESGEEGHGEFPLEEGLTGDEGAESSDSPKIKIPGLLCEYLIITSSSLAPFVDPLRAAKANWPHYARIVITRDISNEFPASSLKESIKKMLQWAYSVITSYSIHYTKLYEVIAAAGNESKRKVNPNYTIGVSIPAAAEGLIAVGALGQGNDGLEIGWFSNTFPQIAAPGVNIVSAKVGGGLHSLSGTSMACPHVAGLAALWWEAVRSQPLPAKASVVASRLLAAATTGELANSVDITDRGVGLAKSPQ